LSNREIKIKITPFIIDKFARFVIGGVPFASMKRIVVDWIKNKETK